MVFVLRTYFFLPDEGAAVVAAFGVEVGLGVGDAVAETKGFALDSLISVRNVSAAAESAVIVMRPASVKG